MASGNWRWFCSAGQFGLWWNEVCKLDQCAAQIRWTWCDSFETVTITWWFQVVLCLSCCVWMSGSRHGGRSSSSSSRRRRRRRACLGAAGSSYLGELGDLLAHLAVHLVIVELLLDVGQLCRSPVHSGARRGGGGSSSGGLCSLTGACSHDEPPPSLSQGNFYDRRTVRKNPAATQIKKKNPPGSCQISTRASPSSDAPSPVNSASRIWLLNICSWIGAAPLVRSGCCPTLLRAARRSRRSHAGSPSGTRSNRPSPCRQQTWAMCVFVLCERGRARGWARAGQPPVSRQGRRGARVSMEHYRRGALLQCCPAPTGAAAVSMSGEGRGRVPGDPGDGRDKLVLSQSNEERLCSHLIRILVDNYLHVWNPPRVKKKIWHKSYKKCFEDPKVLLEKKYLQNFILSQIWT